MLSLSSTQRGSNALLCSEHWPRLLELAPQDPLAFDVIVFAWLNIPIEKLQEPKTQEKATQLFRLLIDLFPVTSKHVLILRTLHRVLPILSTDVSNLLQNYLGLIKIDINVEFSRKSYMARQTCRIHLPGLPHSAVNNHGKK